MWTSIKTNLGKLRAAVPPLTLLVLCGLLLNSGHWLKHPFGTHDDVMKQVHALRQSVQEENWPHAADLVHSTGEAFSHVEFRVGISSDLDHINKFEEELAFLTAAITAEDKVNALEHIAMLEHWFTQVGF